MHVRFGIVALKYHFLMTSVVQSECHHHLNLIVVFSTPGGSTTNFRIVTLIRFVTLRNGLRRRYSNTKYEIFIHFPRILMFLLTETLSRIDILLK